MRKLIKYAEISEMFGIPLHEVKTLLGQYSKLNGLIPTSVLWNLIVAGSSNDGAKLEKIKSEWDITRKARKRTRIEYSKRQSIIERDQNRCRYCGKKVNTNTRVIDHVIPWSKGGRNDSENLVVACRACNMKKSDSLLDDIEMKLIPLENPGDKLGTD